MKKVLTLALALSVGIAVMAQGKSKSNGHGHNKTYEKKAKVHHDEDDHDENTNRNHDVDRDDRNGQSNTGKYSKNLPSKVRSSFNRDYPNATNVSWTKANGYWTASFPNGLYRVRATYAANGQKVNNRSRTNSRTSSNENGSVWDKVLNRQ
ncbi:MAG: hypothetical protein ABIO05_05610 [Ferruginibacter sp.]